MSTQGTSEMSTDKSWVKEIGRRRVFAFFWVFFGLAIVNTLNDESDEFSHVLDNYIGEALVIVAVIVLVLWWKKNDIKSLKMTNNVMTALAVVLLILAIVTLAGLTGETTTEDLGDDIPTLFFSIFMLINRFV